MSEFKELVKNNKRKALSIAVAIALTTSSAGTFVGCTPRYEEEEEEEGYIGGSTSSGHSSVRSGWWRTGRSSNVQSEPISSSDDSIISKDKGTKSKNKASISSKSTGYSKAKGGRASS